MELHELRFGKIILLSSSIAEVIIDDGVEMDEAMVNEYHEFLIAHLQAPFNLLINKINSYSYDFVAQMNLATIGQIKAMAVVAYNRITERSTESLIATPRKAEWNIKIFSNREAAMQWLGSEHQ
ncbi:hypothetical protein [Candidatus Ferrigenium straubiae]|jgi:hypothetical protein|uniref:hypothetical protein n=1 Tax=Candidatus Ferrigenium straubiae TaxID=2919506 RepID=UPI003F4A9120